MTLQNYWLESEKQESFISGHFGLSEMPGLLKQVIEEKMWESFAIDGTESVIHHNSFTDFVTANMPDGLQTTIRILKNLCRDNIETLNILDIACQNPNGRPENPSPEIAPPKRGRGRPRKNPIAQPEPEIKSGETLYIVQDKTELTPAPTGNSRDAGLRRLRETPKKLRDEGKIEEAEKIENLHQEVLDKKKTVHAAMKEAGFKRPKFSAPADDPISTFWESHQRRLLDLFWESHQRRKVQEVIG